ncbi:MAG: rhodanese-like domain-containing protein [Alphaproteobacteria bacterium]|nr:rhodanese-like domain-containing protein [Alphaproteobacteria bacterium]MDE2494309.1 rhodanese-like domain-containing protein [Alphaproteobacteria bacterium]
MVPNDLSSGYAGDLSTADAWGLLQGDATAQLVDVRTQAEWSFVGIPDLSETGRRVHCIAWQEFPGMAQNPTFVDQVDAALGGRKDAPVLFLCRSGGRSRAAATAMTTAGYRRSYNIASGFEGDLDRDGHRGRQNGWKASGLPWRQT